ncbi:MAG: hypothetical protein AB7K09_13490 [Planctomycetota bacterium]
MIRTCLTASLAACLIALLGASGCARNLNQRFEFEKQRAAETYRIEGGYDLQNGRLMQAMQNYTEAVRIWPADAPSHWGMGRIWLTVGLTDKAVHEFALAEAYDESYATMEPEVAPCESPEIMRALLEGRPPPDDANWVAGQ